MYIVYVQYLILSPSSYTENGMLNYKSLVSYQTVNGLVRPVLENQWETGKIRLTNG